MVIPPAYGLQGVGRHTFSGDGDDIAYWNRYVAVTQMGGLGTFVEPRLNLSVTNGAVDLVFEGAGKCATCHTGATFTDASATLHPPADSMAEPETPSHASRSATKQYRTSPLKGVWQHPRYFHDGSAATTDQVVQTYNTRRSLGLTAQEVADVAQYLKSL